MPLLDRLIHGQPVPDGMPPMHEGPIVPDVPDIDPGKAPDAASKPKPKPKKRRRVIDRSPAHLRPAHRRIARAGAVAAIRVMLANAAAAQYTEGVDRWSGIADRRLAKDGQFPAWSDCSSSYTWGAWNELAVRYHRPDVLNDEHWEAGYTGTLIDHGLIIPLSTQRLWLPYDAIFYGDPLEHVAPHVGYDKRYGKHMVIDCGSEGGPYYLPWDYRSDAVACRRYI